MAVLAAAAVVAIDGRRVNPPGIAPLAPPGAPARNDGAPMQVADGYSVGAPFALTDQRGAAVTDADFAGRYMLLFFGYSHCPDICPTELGNISAALTRLETDAPAAAEMVTPIFVSVDPARDTPDVLGAYSAHFHPRLIALTGNAADIAALADAYRVFVHLGEDHGDGNYLVDHSTFTYLMGPQGDFVAMFRSNFDPDGLARSLAQIIADRDE